MGGVQQVVEMCRRASAAAPRLAGATAAMRDRALLAMAEAIRGAAPEILRANAADMAAAEHAGFSAALLDRLALDESRVGAMAQGLRDVAGLPDLLGQELAVTRRPDGLVIRKVRVPLGVIAVIYEARPNVTADAAGLCLKAGSAVILRGGSEAQRSNTSIFEALDAGARSAGMPAGAIGLVPTTDREAVAALLRMEEHIDLVIPRGGESLIRAVAEQSRVPVLKHYKGVCHVYVDRAADLDMALRIVLNAKCQRPGVCNAMECLLVHEAIAASFLPRCARALRERGVEVRGDEATRCLVPEAVPATEADWSTEYLDLILSCRVVTGLDDAMSHIDRYGTHHSDAIVTADPAAAQRFTREVDSAAVYVNASTRFTDGGVFGLGAEIGISTDKLHARGPCGLEALTTYKWVIEGNGQIRES
jgi:glutamate-5-semialdehyde dehydrogenase